MTIAARQAMMAITTRSSVRVNPVLLKDNALFFLITRNVFCITYKV